MCKLNLLRGQLGFTLAFRDLLRWGVGSQRAWPPWLNPCDFWFLFHYTTAWEDTYQANGKMFVYLSDSSNASMFPLEYNSHQHKIVTKTLNCYNFTQLIGWSVLGQNAVLTEISKCISTRSCPYKHICHKLLSLPSHMTFWAPVPCSTCHSQSHLAGCRLCVYAEKNEKMETNSTMPTKKAVKKKCDSVHGFVTFLTLLSLACGI